MKTFASKDKKRLSVHRNSGAGQSGHHFERTQQAGKVRRILKGPRLQPKLKVSDPNDAYEQEADRVADAVMRIPDEALSRQPLEDEEEALLQTKPADLKESCPDLQRQVEVEEEEELGHIYEARLDEKFRKATGDDPLTRGNEASFIKENVNEAIRWFLHYRNEGFEQAINNIRFEELRVTESQFWTAMIGNTLWALAPFAGGIAGKILGIVGQQIASWLGGGPTAADVVKSFKDLKYKFEMLNESMAKELIKMVPKLIEDALNEKLEVLRPNKAWGPGKLYKEIMLSVINKLFTEPEKESGFSIVDTEPIFSESIVKDKAEEDMLATYISSFGTISPEGAIVSRMEAPSIASALKTIGGEEKFACSLIEDYQMVITNLKMVLSAWGCNPGCDDILQDWLITDKLARGSHTLSAPIKKKRVFVEHLNSPWLYHFAEGPKSAGPYNVFVRGGKWREKNIEGENVIITFSDKDYSCKEFHCNSRKRRICALKRVELSFLGKGIVKTGELSTIEKILGPPPGKGQKVRVDGLQKVIALIASA